jgi:hypothetical protein
VIHNFIPGYLDAVAVIEGRVTQTTSLLAQNFDHVAVYAFTGSALRAQES